MQKIHSRYELVVAAGKRGRMLTDGEHPQSDERQLKPVSIALNEIAAGELWITRPKLSQRTAERDPRGRKN
jgi:DNA-directed RNA polymerase subunit omega